MAAFLHVNGTTYELGSALDEVGVTQLVGRIAGGGAPQQVTVKFDDGSHANLTIDTSKVWGVAGWISEPGGRLVF
ncbi:hypothetical protein CWIS_13660 [Cellulomonas sp. A375-1]|uniref:hypothetical protein n=1 Tax=Cellulomonas sp. A375-1 TaxID=1672219 RepID=UPI00065264EA|nr:hypothetical protein [Cellulomonas sp. A375-1]KMM44869.1 hypothetical protein CWIS_13660 [Cellulomonas sp. A375-1]